MQNTSSAGILRVSERAGREAVRAAYLAMAKRYHPHRFAREPADVQTLANEIFLLVKAAYDQLQAEVESSAVPSPVPRKAPTGKSSPVEVARRQAARQTEAGAPAAPVSPSASRSGRSVRFKRPTEPAPPAGAVPGMRTPARQAGNHSELVEELETERGERERRFRDAVAKVNSGHPAEARAIFRELAISDPGERRFRVHMHYAWGREHEAAERLEEAAAEYRRALNLDAGFADAAEALRVLEEKLSSGRGGVFGRLFRRGR